MAGPPASWACGCRSAQVGRSGSLEPKHEPNPHRNVRPNPESNPNQPGTEAPTLTLTLTLTLTTPAWAASELPGLLRARPDGDFLQARVRLG